MEPALRSLLPRLDRLHAQLADVRDGVVKAVGIAAQDPEMALTRTRKVLESVIREVFERRVQEAAGTRPAAAEATRRASSRSCTPVRLRSPCTGSPAWRRPLPGRRDAATCMPRETPADPRHDTRPG